MGERTRRGESNEWIQRHSSLSVRAREMTHFHDVFMMIDVTLIRMDTQRQTQGIKLAPRMKFGPTKQLSIRTKLKVDRGSMAIDGCWLPLSFNGVDNTQRLHVMIAKDLPKDTVHEEAREGKKGRYGQRLPGSIDCGGCGRVSS